MREDLSRGPQILAQSKELLVRWQADKTLPPLEFKTSQIYLSPMKEWCSLLAFISSLNKSKVSNLTAMSQILLLVVSAYLFIERMSSSHKRFQKLRQELHNLLITDRSDTSAAFHHAELLCRITVIYYLLSGRSCV